MKHKIYILLLFCIYVCLAVTTRAQSIALTGGNVIQYCGANRVVSFTVDGMTSNNISGSFSMLGGTSSPFLNIVNITSSNPSVNIITGTLNATTVSYTLTVGTGNTEVIDLNVEIEPDCEIFDLYVSGQYHGFNGAYPIQRGISAQLGTNPTTDFPVTINFPLLAVSSTPVSGSQSTSCNLVWDNTNQAYRRTIRIVNNGEPMSLTGAEVRFVENFSSGLLNITSVTNQSNSVLTGALPAIPANPFYVTISGNNLSLAIDNTDGDANVWGQGEVLTMIEVIDDCPEFNSQIHVEYRCGEMPSGNYCYGSVPFTCQGTGSNTPVISATLSGFDPAFTPDYCYGTGNLNHFILQLTNTSATATDAALVKVFFANTVGSMTTFNFNTLAVTSSLGGAIAHSIVTSSAGVSVEFAANTYLHQYEVYTLTWDGSIGCPVGASCTDISSMYRRYEYEYEGGCELDNQYNKGPYAFFDPNTVSVYMGGLSVPPAIGPTSLVHTGTPGTDANEAVSTYEVNIPANVPYALWPGNGNNRAYILNFTLCEDMVFENNVDWGGGLVTSSAAIIPDVSVMIPGVTGWTSLNNLPSGISAMFQSYSGGSGITLTLPFGTSIGGVTVDEDFLNGLSFQIRVRPHCGSGNPQCALSVTASYVPDRTCATPCTIPIGCSIKRVNIQCPGCIISGIYSNVMYGERYSGDYGLIDDDDNGLADSQVSAFTSTNNQVRRKTLMYGDRVELNYNGEVNLGSGYFPSVSATANTLTAFGNLMAGSPTEQTYYAANQAKLGFNYAYLRVSFSDGDPIPGVGNHFADLMTASDGDGTDPHLLLTIHDGTNDYNFNLSTTNSGINNFMYRNTIAAGSTGGEDEYLYDISVATLNSIGPDVLPTGNGGFRYHDGVTIDAKLIYKLDRNVGVNNNFPYGLDEGISVGCYGSLRAVDIDNPTDWPVDRRYIQCSTPFTSQTVLTGACNNPNTLSTCNNPVNTPSGQVMWNNDCANVQWGCVEGVERINITGFDFDFADFDPPVMRTCGVYFNAFTNHNNETEGKGDVLEIGLENTASLARNFFPFEYRNWMRKRDFDVTTIANSCSLQTSPIFLWMKLVMTTGIPVNNSLYQYNLLQNFTTVAQNCNSNNNTLFGFTYANADLQGSNTGVGMRSPDDMQLWRDQSFFVTTPCTTQCTTGIEFCVRQENDFNPDVTISGNTSTFSTTPNIAEGLEPNIQLVPDGPDTENGELTAVGSNTRFLLSNFSTPATVHPELVWSQYLTPTNPIGVNGTIVYELQVENQSLLGDAPNPWVSIHLPLLSGSSFWTGGSVEIIEPVASNTTLTPPGCGSNGTTTVNGVGGFPDYAVQPVNSFTEIANLQMVQVPIPTSTNNADLIFQIPPQAGHPYDVLRRTALGDGNNNCPYRKSNMRVRITLNYDCDRVAEVLALSAPQHDALQPSVFAGYACDNDMVPTTNPIFDNFYTSNAPAINNQTNVAQLFAQQSCDYITRDPLPFALVGTVVTHAQSPVTGSQIEICNTDLSFSWSNTGVGGLTGVSLDVSNLPMGVTLPDPVYFTVGGQTYPVSDTLNTNTYDLSAHLASLPTPISFVPQGETVTATIHLAAGCHAALDGESLIFTQYSQPYCYPLNPLNSTAFQQVTSYTINSEPLNLTANMLTDCSNQVEFTASGGCGSIYEWREGGVLLGTGNPFTFMFSSAGLHTVTCNSGDCSATVDVDVVPTLDVTVTVQHEVCGLANGEVEVSVGNGTADYTYDLGGTGLTTNQANHTFANLGAHLYTLTVNDVNGCSFTTQVDIKSITDPVVTITKEAFTCKGLIELTATPGFDSYEWSTHETGSSIGVGVDGNYGVTANIGGCSASADINVSVMPTAFTFQGQTYNPVIIGANMASVTSLTNDLIVPGILPSISTSKNLVVYGKLVIDQNYWFEMDHVWMGEGAVIEIAPSTLFDITQTGSLAVDIRSVGSCMWRGIKTGKLDAIRIRNLHIEDAEYAVELADLIKARIVNSTFNRNFTGIYTATHPTGGTYNLQSTIINSNTFDCTAPLYEPYTGMLTDYPNQPNTGEITTTRWSWAGVNLNDVGYIGIGGKNLATANTFRNISNGIWLNRSNVTLTYNNYIDLPESNHGTAYQLFTNPNAPITPNTPIRNGYAVYASGNNLDYVLELTKDNNMQACHYGVYAKLGMNVSVKGGNMQNMMCGILIQNCRNRNIDIGSCHIGINNTTQSYGSGNFKGVGIKIDNSRSPSNIGYISLHNNRLNITGGSFFANNTSASKGVGISINDNTANNGSPVDVIDNGIVLKDAETGMRFLGISGQNTAVNITHNRVWLEGISANNTNNNKNGVELSNCDHVSIEENTVSGIDANTTNGSANAFYPRGFRLQYSSKNTVRCNRAFNLRSGYRFESVCDNTDFASNDIGVDATTPIEDVNGNILNTHPEYYNYVGLYITPNGQGIIGPQTPNKGNRWYGGSNYSTNLFSSNKAAKNLNINTVQFYPIEITPYGSFTDNQSPDNQDFVAPPNLNWFQINATPGQECSPSVPAALVNGGGGTLRFTEFEKSIIADEYDPVLYPETGNWLADRYVYKKLRENETELAMGTIEKQFYDSLSNTAIKDFEQIETEKTLASQTDILLQQEKETKLLFKDEAIKSIVVNDSLLFYQIGDSVQIEQQNDSLLTLLKAKQVAINEHEADILEEKYSKADAADMQNINITTATAFEIDKKETNSYYLREVMKDEVEFDSLKIEKLRTIAEKCFLEAGDAVFEARAMLAIIEERSYEDYDICLEAGYAMKTDGTEKTDTLPGMKTVSYRLYPVPARNFLMVSKQGKPFADEEVEIVNPLAQLVIKARLGMETYTNKIETGMLAPGTYFCRIKSQGATVYSRTIIIAK
ncbi:MAG: T9SS type A sorting domain-containing protein [Chitinophagales bacterium]